MTQTAQNDSPTLKIILGVIGAIALVLAAILGGPPLATYIAMSATKQAEVTQTQIAVHFTPTFTPTPTTTSTLTPTSTRTATPTFTTTPLPTNTPTRTSIPTPVPCPFDQGKGNFTTLVTLINAEAEAVNTRNSDFINLIFEPKAVIRDRTSDPQVNPPAPTPTPKNIWSSPKKRYDDDLFKNTSIRGAKHFDPMVVGQGITATQARLVTGSSGEWLDRSTNTWQPYYNQSKLTCDYGSDHWVFGKNSVGCWVIVLYDFNACHIPFPP